MRASAAPSTVDSVASSVARDTPGASSPYRKPPPPAPASDTQQSTGLAADCIAPRSRVTNAGSQPGAMRCFSCQYSSTQRATAATSPARNAEKHSLPTASSRSTVARRVASRAYQLRITSYA